MLSLLIQSLIRASIQASYVVPTPGSANGTRFLYLSMYSGVCRDISHTRQKNNIHNIY